MKLYFMPGACSLASHIVLNEIGAPHEIEKVGRDKKTASGKDYLTINPKGKVPALELDDGQVLTEGPAILQYLADSTGSETLAPRCGSLERARVNESLNFVGSALHPSFSPLFRDAPEAEKAKQREAVAKNLDVLEQQLSDGRDYLTGPTFTIADAYAAVVAGWGDGAGLEMSRWPKVTAFVARVMERPAATKAAQQEKSA